LSQADLEEMLGPIALYPDTLLANVLAAGVYPDELVAAHTYIKGGGAPATIDQQPWEAPVQSIAKVPEALNFLVDNIEWTTAIGEAYIAQSQDVMAAVQSLRAKAKAGGALQTSEQMAVVESGSNIIIEPSQPDVIYVPQYDPQVVYVDHHDDDDDDFDGGDALLGGVIGFGAGLAVGEIFDDDDFDWDCDWDGGHVDWDNDIDVDRDTNIERNVDRNRETNIETGDINVNVDQSRSANSIGREGQAWQPNNQKVQERKAQTGGASATENFRGVSGQQSAARSKVPTKTSASTTREPAKPVRTNNQAPGVTPASEMNRQRAEAAAAQRPSGGSNGPGGAGAAADRSTREAAPARQTPKPATSKPPERPAPKAKPPTPQNRSAAKTNVPKPKTAPPRAPSKPPSSFSPSSSSAKASSRGASSRSSGGGSRGGGGGGRGGGGGGRR
jgi:hypothetical protein